MPNYKKVIEVGAAAVGNTVSLDVAQKMAQDAAEAALLKASQGGSGGTGSVLSLDMVRQIQAIGEIFKSVKEVTKNPLQDAIENKVGEVAAGVVQNSFSARPPQPQDMWDRVLNSSMANNFMQALGNRAPELVTSMGKTWGPDKSYDLANKMLGGGGGLADTVLGGAEQDKAAKKEKDVEELLSLDPSNPEHVTAYCESQGGLDPDVGRRMMIIHQDNIIKKRQERGLLPPSIQPKPAGETFSPTTNAWQGMTPSQIMDAQYVNTPPTAPAAGAGNKNNVADIPIQNQSKAQDGVAGGTVREGFTDAEIFGSDLFPEAVNPGVKESQALKDAQTQIKEPEIVSVKEKDMTKNLEAMFKEWTVGIQNIIENRLAPMTNEINALKMQLETQNVPRAVDAAVSAIDCQESIPIGPGSLPDIPETIPVPETISGIPLVEEKVEEKVELENKVFRALCKKCNKITDVEETELGRLCEKCKAKYIKVDNGVNKEEEHGEAKL